MAARVYHAGGRTREQVGEWDKAGPHQEKETAGSKVDGPRHHEGPEGICPLGDVVLRKHVVLWVVLEQERCGPPTHPPVRQVSP